jgi:hypothetical protein
MFNPEPVLCVTTTFTRADGTKFTITGDMAPKTVKEQLALCKDQIMLYINHSNIGSCSTHTVVTAIARNKKGERFRVAIDTSHAQVNLRHAPPPGEARVLGYVRCAPMRAYSSMSEFLGAGWERDPVVGMVGPYIADVPWSPTTYQLLKHMNGRVCRITPDGTPLPVCVHCFRGTLTVHVGESGIYCDDVCGTLHTLYLEWIKD